MRIPTLLAAAALALACPTLGDEPADGFSLTALPYPGLAITATLSDGGILTFDGVTVDRYDEFGSYETTLATFSPPVWASFLVVDPAEAFALVGESSNGDLFTVDLSLGSAIPVANLPYNYDADFESSASVLVSAATGGPGSGNEIWRVDLGIGTTTLVATAEGASGPVAVAANGDLCYGTASAAFPPPPAASAVLRWNADLLTGSPVVTEDDAVVLGDGYEAAGSLAIDPVDGRVYLVENDFGSGVNRVRHVNGPSAGAPVLVEGTPFSWITNLELLPGDGEALFRPWQPARGGSLLYNTTDFYSTWERIDLAPQRPAVLLSGAGTSGAGDVDVDVVGGTPRGIGWVLYGPTSLYDPNELAIWIAAQELNVFVGLDPLTLLMHPAPVALDDEGNGTLTVYHDGSQLGLLALQVLVLDAGGGVAAISEVAFL